MIARGCLILSTLTGCVVHMPIPSRYAGEPKHGYRIVWLDDVREVCITSPTACAAPSARPCIIYLQKGRDAEATRRSIEHEKAHCNGWPGSHPS